MAANKRPDDPPRVFIRGIDKIISRDLEKHKGLLITAQSNLTAYRQAVKYQGKRKKHFAHLKKSGKYPADAMQRAIDGMAIDLRHMSDKVKVEQESCDHHRRIIDVLTRQLENYNLAMLAREASQCH